MVKRLVKHGNSLALIIDRPILDLLKVGSDTPIEMSTDGEVLVLCPVRGRRHRRQFDQALESTNRRFARALQRLAE